MCLTSLIYLRCHRLLLHFIYGAKIYGNAQERDSTMALVVDEQS